ncbi:Pyruvate kinase isozyme G [Hibiscus syriacus]|uniref:pyruvate kinase n=1 Tax=Hibiscus syriacus TaxID=106335 RepID=A0A6A3CTW9_HIBSY|nr:Pyruvate kinase isozyme G [Hibiscus syriacus]
MHVMGDVPGDSTQNYDKAIKTQQAHLTSISLVTEQPTAVFTSTNGHLKADKVKSTVEVLDSVALGQVKMNPIPQRKTKIVYTIGPATSSREMIWKLAEAGMNVARLNMSHGDHASHQKTIDLVKEYNVQFKDKVIAIKLDTKVRRAYSKHTVKRAILIEHLGAREPTQESIKSGPEVRSGDVPRPIQLKEGQEFNFTVERGVSTEHTVSVNYDNFVNDVEVGDILLVDGGMMSLAVKSKTKYLVTCVVVDGGELKSRCHLNVGGKSATLPSMTDKDWEDIKFGVDNQVDFYAVSFVKDAKVVHELKDYLKAVKVMHTVALWTELDLPVSCMSSVQFNAYKGHMGEMFAFQSTTVANTLDTPVLVFTRTGSMAILLSHYRPSSLILAFTDDLASLRRSAGATISDENLVTEGESVTLVQSGARPIWLHESTHHIQVRKIEIMNL